MRKRSSLRSSQQQQNRKQNPRNMVREWLILIKAGKNQDLNPALLGLLLLVIFVATTITTSQPTTDPQIQVRMDPAAPIYVLRVKNPDTTELTAQKMVITSQEEAKAISRDLGKNEIYCYEDVFSYAPLG